MNARENARAIQLWIENHEDAITTVMTRGLLEGWGSTPKRIVEMIRERIIADFTRSETAARYKADQQVEAERIKRVRAESDEAREKDERSKAKASELRTSAIMYLHEVATGKTHPDTGRIEAARLFLAYESRGHCTPYGHVYETDKRV